MTTSQVRHLPRVSTFLFSAILATLLCWAQASYADIRPPRSYVEKCTVKKQQKKGEVCEECGAYFRDPKACKKKYKNTAFTYRCRTYGASVWREVWCRPKAASRKKAAKKNSKLPKFATVAKFELGDLACYVFLKDKKGKVHNVRGAFSLCEKKSKAQYLGKKVAVTYTKNKVHHCAPGTKCPPTIVDWIADIKLRK